MDVRVIAVPYDSGNRSVRMGAGPERLLDLDLRQVLEDASCGVTVSFIEATASFRAEIQTSFILNRLLSAEVRGAIEQDALPLILAGNCGSALGTIGGIGPDDIGVIWFDAHGDFNTPETTVGGFLDGMSMAVLTGKCWTGLAGSIPGFQPVLAGRVVYVGACDFDPGERERMLEAGITICDAVSIKRQGIAFALAPALDALAAHVQGVYLHLDLDVIAPAELPVNQYQPDGGLTVTEIEQAITLISEHFAIRAVNFTAYDPLHDPDAKAREVVARLARCFVGK